MTLTFSSPLARKILILSFAFFVCTTGVSQVQIQSSIVSGAYFSSSANYSTEWNVGEVFNELFTSNSIDLAGGILGSNVSLVTGSESSAEDIVSAYPNPFTDFFTIRLKQQSIKTVDCRLYDALGKDMFVPLTRNDSDNITFNTTNLQSGIYVLQIKDDSKKILRIKLLRQ